MDFLKAGHCEVHGLHLGHRGDLGQGEDQAYWEFAYLSQRGDEQVQRLQATCAGGGFEALETDADKRRSCSGRNCGSDSLGGSNGVGVFSLIAAIAVAVFEVQPKVFDRFSSQLGSYPGGNSGSEIGLLAQQ